MARTYRTSWKVNLSVIMARMERTEMFSMTPYGHHATSAERRKELTICFQVGWAKLNNELKRTAFLVEDTFNRDTLHERVRACQNTGTKDERTAQNHGIQLTRRTTKRSVFHEWIVHFLCVKELAPPFPVSFFLLVISIALFSTFVYLSISSTFSYYQPLLLWLTGACSICLENEGYVDK